MTHLARLPNIVEGFLSVVIFSAIIVDEDGIIIIVGVKDAFCIELGIEVLCEDPSEQPVEG